MLPEVLRRDKIRGPVALITAGWRYDEARDEPLRAALEATAHNLSLYKAFQEVERGAPELAAAYTRKQAVLQSLRSRYHDAIVAALSGCLKLYKSAMVAAKSAHKEPALGQLPECPWLEAAVAHLQQVDRLWLEQADALHTSFEEEVRPFRNRLVRAEVVRIADVLRGCEAVLVAGGHVGVLRNRMFFFGLDRLLQGKKIYAWSGGAMALCDQILLYHDHTPYGVGTAEIFDRGLGLIPHTFLLAHARQRLDLNNHDAIAILRARLAPRRAICLENGAVLDASDFTEGGNHETIRNQGRPASAFALGMG